MKHQCAICDSFYYDANVATWPGEPAEPCDCGACAERDTYSEDVRQRLRMGWLLHLHSPYLRDDGDWHVCACARASCWCDQREGCRNHCDACLSDQWMEP